MDFAALPPEVNSARIYAGAGAGPMIAAAVAWDGLAAELHSAASSYASVVAGLTGGPWQGPASIAMRAAAAPYVAWMTTTAMQAEQAANQARAAVSAYETAFLMTVPPPVIAANRALLMSLVATNFLGQNTPAIAATQAHYLEMWAQDAAAMYGYAAASAAASTLTPFTAPQQSTNPGGLGAQAAAVAHAAGTSAGDVQPTLSQLLSSLPTTLQGLASPTSGPSSWLSGLTESLWSAPDLLTSLVSPDLKSADGLSPLAAAANTAANAGASVVRPAVAGGLGPGAGAPAVSAGLGQAESVGPLSVPPSWGVAAPTTSPVATTLPGTSLNAAPALTAEEGPDMYGMSGMPLMGWAAPAAGGEGPRYGFTPIVMPRVPAIG